MVSQFDQNRRNALGKKLCSLMDSWRAAHPGEKLTDETLGDAIHASREAVNGWRNGKSYPSASCLSALCGFFSVPESYFDPVEGELIYTDEQRHRELDQLCRRTADHIGLSESLLRFIKERPGLADLVIKASYVNPVINPPDSKVPDNPDDSPFQFVSSLGVRVYLPEDVLYMLRCVQRDLEEYAGFMIQKYSGTISAHYHSSEKERRSENYVPPVSRFALDLDGMSSLNRDESMLVDVFRRLDPQGRKDLIQRAAHNVVRVRKGEGKTK